VVPLLNATVAQLGSTSLLVVHHPVKLAHLASLHQVLVAPNALHVLLESTGRAQLHALSVPLGGSSQKRVHCYVHSALLDIPLVHQIW
jgi:hypothetical protein